MSGSHRFIPSLEAGEVIDWDLSQEDIAHLLRAFGEWRDYERFTDDDVARVKAIFCFVFSLGPSTVLEGTTTSDALVLHEPCPAAMAFGMMVEGDRLAFVRLPCRMWGLFELVDLDFRLMCRIVRMGEPIGDDELETIRRDVAAEE